MRRRLARTVNGPLPFSVSMTSAVWSAFANVLSILKYRYRCQPRVERLRDADATVTQDQRAWRLLAAMAGSAKATSRRSPSDHHTMLLRS